MTDTRNTLPAEMVTSLLTTAQRVMERGDLPRARSLLRSLAEQAPGDWQVWQALAEVAETDAERVAALERLASLADPTGPRVTRRLDALDAIQPAGSGRRTTERLTDDEPLAGSGRRTTERLTDDEPPGAGIAAIAAAPLATPRPDANDHEWAAPRVASPTTPPAGWFRSHWLTYASIAVIALLLFAVALMARARLTVSAVQPTATPALATPVPQAATAALPGVGQLTPLPATVFPQAPTAIATPLPAEAPGTLPTAAVELTALPLDPTAAAAAPTSIATTVSTGPTGPTGQSLAPGQVVERGNWSVTVLQPNHLLPLSGSIGSLPPQGRFVLALVAVSNRGAAPERPPADLLVLIDQLGTRYLPAPSASTAYLSVYERGVRGDLSLEEEVPAGAGIVSIPVIFDVPPDASGLVLQVDGAPSGWAFGQ